MEPGDCIIDGGNEWYENTERRMQETAVEVTKDRNGTDQVLLRNPRGASARVSLHGGQVLSWRADRGEELLFTSSKAVFKPPYAVRGGIPICFPQFGQRGSLEQHGFARNRTWIIDENPPPLHPNDSDGKAYIDLLLKPSEDDLKIWPHSFEFRLRVYLTTDGNLSLISRIRNINCKPFSFSIAYHTYFSISDISEVRVEGLETLDYLDNLCQRERFTEQGDALTFESEVDRVYLGSRDVIAIFDHERKRTFFIRKEGLPDVGVWNPWEKKSKAIADFGDEEYKQMLCVNGAAVEKPITLKPGEEWTGRLELSVVPSMHQSTPPPSKTIDQYVVAPCIASTLASKLKNSFSSIVCNNQSVYISGKSRALIMYFLPRNWCEAMLKDLDDGHDKLTRKMQELNEECPTLFETIVDERDQYMSSTLLSVARKHNSVVAVVGRGHLPGIQKYWKQPVSINELMTIPPQKPALSTGKILASPGFAIAGVAIVWGIYLANKI
ncbi:hypothetical protein V6N12_005047 [Hibiscus sabdariffa]